MMKSFFDFKTLSEAALLIQIVIAVGYLILILFVAFLISENEIKPKWFRYSIYVFLYLVTESFFRSWDEKRIFAAWAENFVAVIFWRGGQIGGIACGYFVGMRVFEKTSKLYQKFWPPVFSYNKPLLAKILGWIVGIAIAIIVILITIKIGEMLPSIGWRLDKITDE